MSRRQKHNRGRDETQLFERAQRELARGNSREALKEARLCYRAAATDEHHRLLERVLVVRIDDLHRAGCLDQARANLAELLQLGVTVPDVGQQLPRLRVLLGTVGPQPGPPPADLLDANPDLLPMLADQAVLHPDRCQAPAAVQQEAEAVRAALEAIAGGDEAAATERLNTIARQSPLADWKLLARGLTAYYAADRERMVANWDRLAPTRAAYRIAQALRVACGETAPAAASVDVSAAVRRLEYAVQSGGVMSQLKLLADYARENRWSELLQAFRSFRQRYGQSHASLLEKLTDLLWRRFVRDGAVQEFDQLVRAAAGPPLDPRWNRARALLAELNPRACFEEAEDHWQAYVDDLATQAALADSERPVAMALVAARVARRCVGAARRALNPPPPALFTRPNTRLADELYGRAIRQFRAAIQHHPGLLAAHEELADLYAERGQPDNAVVVRRGLLKHFPDHYDTLVRLARYYHDEDDPRRSHPFVTAACRVKPRGPQSATLLWNQRLAEIRQAVRKRRFDEAHEAVAAAAAAAPPDVEPVWMDALRATIEFKANRREAAEQHVQTAVTRLEEPTAVWLMMSSNAARGRLPKEIKKEFDTRFKAAVTGVQPGRSQTAGHLARFLLGCSARSTKATKYVGLVTHQRLTLKYLERCRGISWNVADLRHVVWYLSIFHDWRSTDLLRGLLARALAAFPEEPLFHFWAGEIEVRNGPFCIDHRQTRAHFERALELAKASPDALPEELVTQAKQALVVLDRSAAMAERMFGPAGDEDEEYEDEEGDEYDDEEDDEFDDDGWDDADDEEYEDSPLGGLSPQQMLDLMPPEVLAEFQKKFGKQGIDVLQAIRDLLHARGVLPDDDDDDLDEPLPHARRHKGRRTARQKR